MAVDTRRVQGRRALTFRSLEDVLADAQSLVAVPGGVRTLGNWSLGQLLLHLAGSINHSMDGNPHRAPWIFRLLWRLVKGGVLRKGIQPGFKLPSVREADAFPPAASDAAALEALCAAIARTRAEPMDAAHPFFGKLTDEQWRQFHCRHAELHLSFVVPSAVAQEAAAPVATTS